MNEDYGKVSIIIPVYNGQNTIGRTLSMILQSSYTNIEIIVVNDGSSDNSIDVCKKFQKEDNRIFVYTKDNGGVASARNYGVEHSTGKYLCFCDQDDYVERDMYLEMIKKISQDNSEICMCSTGRMIDGKKSSFEILTDATYREKEIREEILYPMLFKGYNVPVKMTRRAIYPCIWNCMFDRDFFETNELKFRVYVNYEDDLLLKNEALSRAKKVSTVSYEGYYWCVNLKSETYANRFVENIGKKQQLCYDDMEKCLRRCTEDEVVLRMFKAVTMCKQYLDAVHVLASTEKKKNYRFIKQFYKEQIFDREFGECIVAREYVAKGQVRALVLLPILSCKCPLLIYFSEKLLSRILWISLHSQVLTSLERKIKESR